MRRFEQKETKGTKNEGDGKENASVFFAISELVDESETLRCFS